MRAASIAVIAVIILALSHARAGAPKFKIIVHPNNPVTVVGRDVVRNAFLKKGATWSSGETIRAIDLTTKFPTREQFTREVLRKTPAQLKTYWNQQIFSGKGVPPPEMSTTDDMVSSVLADERAIGYIPANVDAHGAKVIGVR